MKVKKFYTVKQWSKFKSNDYFDMQELLCQNMMYYFGIWISRQNQQVKT